ncbi:MAG TPA: SIMPL domain-containing protein [Allosphingosinicella sp.]
MKRLILASLAACAAMPALAQPTVPPPLTTPINGVRLDVVATGEVTRVPDQVTISAGVTSRAPQAQAALRDNGAQMERVRAALRRLGIADRDIQTGTISLNQDYERSPEGARPSGYVASNQLNIRFRDVANAGRIIDALVAEGVNNVQGPMFGLENRDSAVDEARTRAIAVARARADLYARTLGTRARRIVAISEAGQPGIIMGEARMAAVANDASTQIVPGEQVVGTTVSVTFELDPPVSR